MVLTPPAEPAVPAWLQERLENAGGRVPFRTYMEWVLHDPAHGAYGSGRLRIGPHGDFATSPSLGPEFAALLAPQLAEWLEEIHGPVALVETGPGEGQLALQLAEALAAHWPALAQRCTLVLVEPSAGLAARPRQRLADAPLPVRWVSFEELAAEPVRGVVLAHEVLDALAIERIVWDGSLWRRQDVVLTHQSGGAPALRLEPGEPLPAQEQAALEPGGVLADALSREDPRFPDGRRPAGWCTELHPGLPPWLEACGAALAEGHLLVIDYAHEARRYYAPQRSAGTLMAYRAQQATEDPLREPGHWDLTAHLCLESLEAAALAAGWWPLGGRRQGEALLALGLAERLHGLQQGSAAELASLLARREALLRLVDPHTLGDFRWVAFARGPQASAAVLPRFLQDPHPVGAAPAA
ncbi:MAG: class I SAM-dependent methyltransferase [Cyanobacteriota bacterium]